LLVTPVIATLSLYHAYVPRAVLLVNIVLLEQPSPVTVIEGAAGEAFIEDVIILEVYPADAAYLPLVAL
jgi:hypothetical protein